MPTKDKYEEALEGDTNLYQNVAKLGELNKLAYKDIILHLNQFCFMKGGIWICEQWKKSGVSQGKMQDQLVMPMHKTWIISQSGSNKQVRVDEEN